MAFDVSKFIRHIRIVVWEGDLEDDSGSGVRYNHWAMYLLRDSRLSTEVKIITDAETHHGAVYVTERPYNIPPNAVRHWDLRVQGATATSESVVSLIYRKAR
jgi:hypothetical protein